MSQERLRQDLHDLQISGRDASAILSPNSPNASSQQLQHAFCARFFTLRELDCTVDLVSLLRSGAFSGIHLSTFVHHCTTVYTHQGNPLYFMCGPPFDQLLLFEVPEQLADYAASQEYQVHKQMPFSVLV